MGKERLCAAIETLREQFLTLDWTYHDFSVGSQSEKMYRWPGQQRKKYWFLFIKAAAGRSCFTDTIFSISTILIRGSTIR